MTLFLPLSLQDDIIAAPSVLQHEVKSLSHSLLQQVINRVYTLDTAKLNGQLLYQYTCTIHA